MLLVEIDTQEANYIVVDEEPYFCLDQGHNRYLVCQDRCPHRGGPLHLGNRECRTGAVICPWHGMAMMIPAMERRSIPAVMVGKHMTAIFDAPEDTPVRLMQRRIIANER